MKNHFSNKKHLLIILLLGFSSGLPLALTGTALQAWFTTSNLSLEAIGALTLIGQPYIYKFIWAPLFDYFKPPFLGRRRGWLLITQTSLLLCISLMALCNPHTTPYFLVSLAILVAFLSASQDIVFNAYMTDILSPTERGLGAAMQNGGYRFAMMVSGGLSLILANYIGWHLTYLIMASLMLVGIFTTWLGDEPPYQFSTNHSHPSLDSAFRAPLREFLSRKAALSILLFIILYKLGDALSLSLATPFFIRDLHFSLLTVGIGFKEAGLIASLLGVFTGGIIMTRLSLFRSLMLFGILQIVAILLLMQLAIIGKNYPLFILSICGDSFFNAMGSTALLAFLMSLCDHRYTAAQFALFSAIASVGRIFVGPVAGVLVSHMGWISFFAWSAFVSLPGLALLFYLRKEIHNTMMLQKTA